MREGNPVRITVDIAAPIEVTWRVMADFDDYGRWNPFVVSVQAPANVDVGCTLQLEARMPNGQVSRPKERVLVFEPPRSGRAELRYELIGPMSWMVSASRSQVLTALGDYGCRYESTERFGGPLCRLVPFDQVHEATLLHADGLKWAAEGALIRYSA